jgi:20S proteasome subunit beta 5
LTDEEAQELGRRSIVAAGHRDGYSGNTNNLYHVRENGWEFLGNMDISDLWYKYEEEKKQARKEKTEEAPVESMQVE